MNTIRRRMQVAAWIALVAMLALALVPPLSRALGGGAGGADHCAMPVIAAATRMSEAGPSVPRQPQAVLDHCPLCALGQGALGLPPVAPALANPGRRAQAVGLWRPLQSPPRLPPWRRAQPRAPPRPA